MGRVSLEHSNYNYDKRINLDTRPAILLVLRQMAVSALREERGENVGSEVM